MELASSDAAAILFFLEEEKEKNGGANRADSVAHPYKGSQKIHGIATPACALISQWRISLRTAAQWGRFYMDFAESCRDGDFKA